MNHRGSLTRSMNLQTCLHNHPGVHEVNAAPIADNKIVIKMLNDAMATALIGVLLYRRYHFRARSLRSHSIEQVFLDHSNAALTHADWLAARIVQLGGTPVFVPDGLTNRSDTEYVEDCNLSGMIRESMVAKCLAIDLYSRLIQYLGNSDTTTRFVLEEILIAEQQHNDQLAEQLIAMHIQRRVTWPQSSAATGQSCLAIA